MIILLTGLPGSGKTTVLENFLKLYKRDCFWIISRELRNDKQERIGFEAVTSDGRRGIFAHKEIIQSENKVGNYSVDLNVIDELFCDSIRQIAASSHSLFVLDEIGRMEMLSKKFAAAVDWLFETDISVLATIRHEDKWTEKYKNNQRAITFEVTDKNREQLPEILRESFTYRELVKHLTSSQTQIFYKKLKKYAQDSQLIQVKKLFKRALKYVAENRVRLITDNTWQIQGDYQMHRVSLNPETGTYSCDCDLFLGKSNYQDHPGECSHIQTVILFRSRRSVC